MRHNISDNRPRFERYELESSPFSQNPTQRQVAELLGTTKSKLENIIKYKETYVVRRVENIRGKERRLIYPFGAFRRIHERLKYHLSKIKQPDYMYSPRKGKSIRDNAIRHKGQVHFLKLDIKQFYPSTTSEHIYRWARNRLGLRDDVAGLLVHLSTIDGKVSFGSPLTPVLATLIHRKMFDEIYVECTRRGLRMSIWVDDITISGKFVPGELITRIRDIIRSYGLKSHKLEVMTGSRSVSVTGVMIRGSIIDAPRVLHNSIKDGYSDILNADDRAEAEIVINKLLSQMGRYRYIVGSKSQLGVSTSNRMNTLRQRKQGIINDLPNLNASDTSNGPEIDDTDENCPF